MKNKTILKIIETYEMYKSQLLGISPKLISDDGVLKVPTDEEIEKEREQIQKEFEEWLEQEIEDAECQK